MRSAACLLGIAVLTLVSCGREKNSKAAVPKDSLADVKWGKPVTDAGFDKHNLLGRVVVVEEWGANCPDCLTSLPKMATLAKTEADKGLVVVGLERQNGTKENVLKILKSTRVEYPIQSGGSAPGNTDGIIPYACVFDVTGQLVYNGSPLKNDFESAVKKALLDVKSK